MSECAHRQAVQVSYPRVYRVGVCSPTGRSSFLSSIQSYSTPYNDTLLAVQAGDCGEFIAERSRPSPYTDFIQIGIDAGQSPGTCVYPLEAAPLEPLPLYPNQTFEAIFSLLNLGNSDRTGVAWKVYLSPTDAVTGSSTLVATFSSDLNVNIPYERPTDLTIPSTMAAGTYYVIAVMDPASAITERDETNNVAIWNQQVVVSSLPSCSCSTGGPVSVGSFSALLALLAVVRRRR